MPARQDLGDWDWPQGHGSPDALINGDLMMIQKNLGSTDGGVCEAWRRLDFGLASRADAQSAGFELATAS